MTGGGRPPGWPGQPWRPETDYQPDEFVGAEADSLPSGSANIHTWLPPIINLEITGRMGGGGQYSWREVYLPSKKDAWADAGGGRGSDTLGVPAVEANGRAVKTGGVYEARLHESGEYYLFWAGGEGDDTVLAQITEVTWSGSCPTYTVFRVSAGAGCGYSDGPFARHRRGCVTQAFHEQEVGLVAAPPPSPRKEYPGTAGEDASAGTATWSDVDSALNSDDSHAASTTTAGQQTRYLKLTDFCFALPTYVMSVTNVEVRVEARASASSSVRDAEVKLIVGGTIGGTSKHTGTALTTSDAVYSYSHTPSAWGHGSLTPGQVNASNFGVALRYENYSGAMAAVLIDTVEVRVSFTPASDAVVGSCVVRLRWNPDEECWQTNDQPRVEVVRKKTPEETEVVGGVVYYKGYRTRVAQFGGAVTSIEEVLLRPLNP
jgi:hypothetical protein